MSDMNVHPLQATAMLLNFKHLLMPGSIVILTLKHPTSDSKRCAPEVFEQFRSAGFQILMHRKLLSNGDEDTLIAQLG